MLKRLLFSAAIIAMPAFASAATLSVTAVNEAAIGSGTTVGAVDRTKSVDLTGVGSWDFAPLETNDGFKKRAYISPFSTSWRSSGHDNVTSFWAVGNDGNASRPGGSDVYAGLPTVGTPAEFSFDGLTKSVSFLWGSPDGNQNTLSLTRDGTVFKTFNGEDVLGAAAGVAGNLVSGNGAAYITITASGDEYFDGLLFGSSGQTFEFSNISAVSAVPLPAGVPLILTALGGFAYLARRKKNTKAA
ncbi:hypothetical protein ROLI_046160 (plasmid) [Roseobacter fucihabitans]|uniref:Uncharacterized protein n=1 Tax=Roseobacter fucihabitans TaxID=1537242 RepID=A0ABZ2BZR2_9RHOB|nr:VPLPA-CTERM sorting domain-containing protein [Roseobacter litoralis]MBC6966904.1 hypothetical protein [Roseobacter litoralis]